MKSYLEIAVPLASSSLTFFIGTGLSKFVTNGSAPNWLELAIELTKQIDKPNNFLLDKLFNSDGAGGTTDSKFPLEICSQIIELEYKNQSKDIRATVAEVIKTKTGPATLNKEHIAKLYNFFEKHPTANIITTNYDTLLTEHILPKQSRVLIEGSPIPRHNIGQTVYHIHGSILKPSSITITLNDYYRFQQRKNYFSQKFYTLLQETTVVILGYSLRDFNLNYIFNEVQGTRSDSLRKRDIYLVTRDKIDDIYKTFYSYTYGIDVVDETTIDSFFMNLELFFDRALTLVDQAKYLKDALEGTATYVDDFLKLSYSLSGILLQATNLGITSNNYKFLELLKKILEKKKQFTHETGAWDQYAHLAEWLVEIGSLFNVRGTLLETTYIEMVKHSFSYMSKNLVLGYSWEAFRRWEYGFQELTLDNQSLIREKIATHEVGPDALLIVGEFQKQI